MDVTKKNKKTLALKHYDEMLIWIKENKSRFDDTSVADIIRTMYYEANTSTGASFCSYCQYYNNMCVDCELSSGKGKCCDGLWLKMYLSTTISEFIDRMEDVRSYIELNG